eukprot:1575817-Pleurochrysis_carterae.AAC.1
MCSLSDSVHPGLRKGEEDRLLLRALVPCLPVMRSTNYVLKITLLAAQILSLQQRHFSSDCQKCRGVCAGFIRELMLS